MCETKGANSKPDQMLNVCLRDYSPHPQYDPVRMNQAGLNASVLKQM